MYDVEAPLPRDYGRETKETLQAQVDLAPQLYQSEAEFQPKYNALSMNQLQRTLMGSTAGARDEQYFVMETVPDKTQTLGQDASVQSGYMSYNEKSKKYFLTEFGQEQGWVMGKDGNLSRTVKGGTEPVLKTRTVVDEASPGVLDMYENDIAPTLSRIEADSLSKQREADIAAVEKYGVRATEALRKANPELYAQLARAEGLGAAGGGAAQAALQAAALAGTPQYREAGPQQFATDRVGARNIYGDAVYGDRVNAQNVARDAVDGDQISAREVAGQNVYGDRVNAQNVSSGLAAFDRVGNRDVGLGDSGLLTELNRQAMEELQAGQSLTAAEQRAAQQASRAAFASRGLAMGDQAVADEVLRNYQLGAERQNQRRAFAQNVEQQNRAFAGQGLQAQQTNQDAALRAALANQQGGIQTGQVNVQNNLQAQLANQQAWMEAGRLNQATGLQAGQFNSQNNLQAQLANQQYGFEASRLNQSTGLQAQLANQQTGMQAQLANQQAWMEAGRLNQATGLQAQLANQQTGLQAQQANQQAWMEADRLNQATGLQQGLAYQQLGLQAQLNNRDFANQLDARRFQQLGQASEMAQRQQAGDRGYAGQLVGLRQGTSQDPFMAILGRPSQAFAAGQGFGNQAMGYAQSGGPTLFNPESSYAGNMYNQQWQGQLSANMATAANNTAILSSGISAVGTIGAAAAKCWVAREVYGAENPRWLLFRDWLETTAPDWFHSLYIRFGERFARCIRPFPRVKAAIRRWMDSKINERG